MWNLTRLRKVAARFTLPPCSGAQMAPWVGFCCPNDWIRLLSQRKCWLRWLTEPSENPRLLPREAEEWGYTKRVNTGWPLRNQSGTMAFGLVINNSRYKKRLRGSSFSSRMCGYASLILICAMFCQEVWYTAAQWLVWNSVSMTVILSQLIHYTAQHWPLAVKGVDHSKQFHTADKKMTDG